MLTDQEKELFNQQTGVDYDQLRPEMFTLVGIQDDTAERLSSKPYSYWRAVNRLLFTSPVFIISATLLVAFVVLAVVVPWGKDAIPLPDYRPGTAAAAPTLQHIFGLGMLGEDYWLEIWAGMRTTLLFALLVSVIQIITGVLVGSIWGYFRRTDILFIQLTNFLQIVPQMILLLLMVFLFGKGYWPMVFGVCLQAWILIASTIRVQVILVKNSDYNVASITLGSRSHKIIRKNIIPKILPVIVQSGAFAIPSAIGIDAFLSYLGFGFVDGNKTTSLGTVLSSVMSQSQWEDYPHLILVPTILITAVSIIFFLTAKVFADALDPKNHR